MIENDNQNLLRQYWGELKMMLGSYNMPTWDTFVSIVGKVKRLSICSQKHQFFQTSIENEPSA